MRRLALILAALCLALLPATAVAAPERANLPDIEDEVMCPVCGTPLNLAESPQANRERALIRRLIAEGKTKRQIKDRLVAEYGQEVIAEPDGGGFELTAWLVPIAVVLGALAALALVVPRWRRGRAADEDHAPSEDDGPALSPAEASRLDDELAHFKG